MCVFVCACVSLYVRPCYMTVYLLFESTSKVLKEKKQKMTQCKHKNGR